MKVNSGLPPFPEFVKLQLHHGRLIEEYFRDWPPYSDHTFSSLWSWDNQDQVELSDLHGNLVIRLTDYLTNTPFYTFLGDRRLNETLKTLFAFIEGKPDHLPYLKLIPENNLKNANLPEGFLVVEDLDNHDYVYSLERLAELRGNKLRGKRNFTHRFQKNYRWEVRDLDLTDPATLTEMERLAELWSKRQREAGNEIGNEMAAVRKLLNAKPHLRLLALGLYVDGRLVGYTINEINQGHFATNLFEHADTDCVGAFPFLHMQTARKLLALGHRYLSHQQDLGLPGLRKSKRDYAPLFYLKKYIVKKG